ncbi:MAG: endonuclease/exonuclease/phosphatase family protein [bacterium]|nr:endonuclease/exonuclease/phosphatase family protein [bacterium]
MKLVSINVEQNKHFDKVLPFLTKEKPDVICFQEVLKSDLLRYEKALNKQSFFKPLFKGSKSLGHGDISGVAILADNFSRTFDQYYYGSEDAITLDQSPTDASSRGYAQQPVVIGDVSCGGEMYRIATTHFTWTPNGESTPYQLSDVEKLLLILEKEGELVLIGDFNAPRGRETFSRLASKYKDNIPLEYKTSIDQNFHRVGRIQFMVDGLFTTPAYVASNVRLVDGVSDHMAIVTDINKN